MDACGHYAADAGSVQRRLTSERCFSEASGIDALAQRALRYLYLAPDQAETLRGRLPGADGASPSEAERRSAVREFAKDLFVEESAVRFYGFRVQTRMAIVRLAGSRLLLYSPVPLRRRLRQELEQLGRISFIVSPNKIHNLTLAEYRTAFSEAKLLVPPGLPERMPGLPFDAVLSDEPVPDWSPDLRHVLTRGNMFFAEALLFHRPSRTLLVGDLVERIGPGIASPIARGVARLLGVSSHPMASPEFRYYTADADAFEAGMAEVLRWPIERVFLCHGDLIEEKGREVVARVVDTLVEEVRGRGRARRALFERLARIQ